MPFPCQILAFQAVNQINAPYPMLQAPSIPGRVLLGSPSKSALCEKAIDDNANGSDGFAFGPQLPGTLPIACEPLGPRPRWRSRTALQWRLPLGLSFALAYDASKAGKNADGGRAADDIGGRVILFGFGPDRRVGV